MDALFGDEGFQIALAWSAGLSLLAIVLSRLARVEIGFAVVGVVASLVVFREEYYLGNRLVIGIVLLAVGGEVAARRPAVLRVVVTIPGAAFVALSLEGVPRWVKGVAFVATVIGAPLVATSDRRAPRVAPPLVLVTVVGVYACVPDTELARILVGAFLAAALLAFDPRLRAVAAGSSAAVGVVVWDACQEGAARPGAVIGAAACLGALVILPVFGRRLRLVNPWSAVAWWVAAVHVALVVWCSRVAGLRQSAWVAAVLVVLGFAVASGVLMFLQRASTPPRSA